MTLETYNKEEMIHIKILIEENISQDWGDYLRECEKNSADPRLNTDYRKIDNLLKKIREEVKGRVK